MRSSHLFQLSACVAVAVLYTPGQLALAQESHHRSFVVVPGMAAEHAAAPERAPAPTIYPLQATRSLRSTRVNTRTATGPICGPVSASLAVPPAPNPDCPAVGNPSIPLPVGGVVLGVPPVRVEAREQYEAMDSATAKAMVMVATPSSTALPVRCRSMAQPVRPNTNLAVKSPRGTRMIPTTREMICCSES